MALLDNFNRANSSGFGANWTQVPSLGSQSEIVSNEAKINGANAQVWSASTFGVNQEVYCTLKTIFTDGSHVWLLAQVVTPGAGSFTGYLLDIIEKSGVVDLVLYRGNSGSYTNLGSSASNEPLNSGDVWMLRKVGAVLTVLRNGTAVTSGSIGPITDPSPLSSSTAYIGLGGSGPSNVSMDDFGGGNVVSEQFGSSSLTITDTVTTAGLAKRLGASTLVESVSIATIGKRTARGESSLVETVQIDTVAHRNAHGQVSVVETITITTRVSTDRFRLYPALPLSIVLAVAEDEGFVLVPSSDGTLVLVPA